MSWVMPPPSSGKGLISPARPHRAEPKMKIDTPQISTILRP